MKMRTISLSCVLLLAAFISISAQSGQGQGQPSADELKAAQAIAAAPDVTAKLKAAADFVKKYPKSSLRERVAHGMVDQISPLTDQAQKATLSELFLEAFKNPAEQEMIMPILIEGLIGAKRIDDAFASGSQYLTQNPDSLLVLIQLAAAGTNEAKAKNGKFVPQSLQYSTHAIQLVETDKKPGEMDAASWATYKKEVLPGLYQSVGLLNLVKGDRIQARAAYSKAAELSPTDAFNVLMLAGILNDDYQNEAKKYQAMPAGPAKDEELKKAQALMDSVIDSFARAVALSEGNASLQQVRQQYLQDLESYYKYRHNNSTEGMQALIDKYKAPAKP